MDAPILVVLRGWSQQENPARPLLPADAPALLAGRLATAVATVPGDATTAISDVRAAAGALGLDSGGVEGVVAHALRAHGDRPGELRIVVADVGGGALTYVLVKPLAHSGSGT